MTVDNLQLSAPVKSAALGQLREPGMGLSAPFSQHVLVVDRARIAGTAHHGDSEDVLRALEIGEKLKLMREPTNRHDPWTIRILAASGRTLGFLPADINEILSRLMDAGKHIYAKVIEKDDTGTWLRIYVEVYLDD